MELPWRRGMSWIRRRSMLGELLEVLAVQGALLVVRLANGDTTTHKREDEDGAKCASPFFTFWLF